MRKRILTALLVFTAAVLPLSGEGRTKDIKINFFGGGFAIKDCPAYTAGVYNAKTVEDIRGIRKRFAKYDISPLLEELTMLKEDMRLNDWGYLQLMKEVAAELLPSSENGQKYIVWGLLEKAGYDVRAAFSNNGIYILMPNRETVYGTMFTVIEGEKYYNFRFDEERPLSESFYLYPDENKGRGRIFSLVMDEYPELPGNRYVNTFEFNDGNTSYAIDARYDMQVIEFLRHYPQTELAVYFKAPWYDGMFIEDLKAIVRGKSEYDAVNTLLRFMHQAFEYGTDEEQFGYEKVLFPHEMFFYSYSDCEDRTVFFAKLVKTLLGLDVIGVEYPNHVSAAVRFNADVSGDSVQYRGAAYVIADPSYVNAGIGVSMPGLTDEKVNVIEFE